MSKNHFFVPVAEYSYCYDSRLRYESICAMCGCYDSMLAPLECEKYKLAPILLTREEVEARR